MPTTRISDVELYWELNGHSGDPLVLVHGSWGDHHGWDLVVPMLARSFRVLTYDRRGHSQSARPVGQGSISEDVADLAALIEQLGVAPAHVLGNSFGASIALRLAAQRPDLFRSLLVHEPPLFGLLPPASGVLDSIQERIEVVVDALNRGEIETGARQFVETVAFGPGAWQQLPAPLREIFVANAPTFLDEQRDPLWPSLDVAALTRFSKPALLSQGDQSEAYFPLVVEQIAQALPHAQRHTFAGAGHVPHVTHPEQFVHRVGAFIAQVASTARSESDRLVLG